MDIGFIGVGQMGGRMAQHLVAAGYGVTVYDINKAAAAPLLDKGAKWGDTPKKLAESCPVVITMVPGPPEVEQTVYGAEGLMAGWKKGDIYLDMTTSLPSLTRRIAKDAVAKGVTVLDAPVTGGITGAQDATLTIFVGGTPENFQKVSDILKHMGKVIMHMGDTGCGNITKLVNNLISISVSSINAEAMVLGVRAGMDTRKLWEAVTNGTGNNRNLQVTWPRTVLAGNFEPAFQMNLAAKDVGLALALAEEYSLPLNVAAAVKQRLIEAKGAGLGKESSQSVIWRLEELAGVKVRFQK
ncbi:MAG: NAD(P)-dependent oxidoreductase [Chloroflexota bacterium]